MRKRFAYLSLLLLAAMVSCRKEGKVEITAETGTEAVRLGSSIMLNKVTKTLGPLDDWNSDQQIYVYGIARSGKNENSSPTVLNFNDDFFMDNVPISQVPVPGNHPEVPHEVTIFKPGSTEPFYYKEDYRYEFFGYYVDNAVTPLTEDGRPNPHKTASRIELPITIDGGQDILAAVTDKDDDNSAMLNINRLYSGYTARKGVVPNLIFKHQLSRFNVYMKSGDRYDATHDENLAKLITLDKVLVNSNTDATLVIANKKTNDDSGISLGNGLDETTFGNPQWLNVIRGDDCHQLSTADGLHPAEYWTKDSFVGSVMVMPGKDKYPFQIVFVQDGFTEQETVIREFTLDFADLLPMDQDPKYVSDGSYTGTELDAVAQPGHQYDVNIVVYGLQKVVVTVSLTPWEKGGSLLTDSDPGSGLTALNIEMDDVHVYRDSVLTLSPGIKDLADLTGVKFSYDIADADIASVDIFGNLKGVGVGTTLMLVEAFKYKLDANGEPQLDDDGSLILEGRGQKTVNVTVSECPTRNPKLRVYFNDNLVPNGGTVTWNIVHGLTIPVGETHEGPGTVTFKASETRNFQGQLDSNVLIPCEGGFIVVGDIPEGSAGDIPTATATITASINRADDPALGVVFTEADYVVYLNIINVPE